MTQHEQKPESAEFRTLETQVSECARDLRASLIALDEKLYSEFVEAEFRGAAWQRQSDAEDNEIARWQAFECGRGWFDISNDERSQYGEHIRPLYTHPANVAALEARVKELEGEVKEEQRISNLRGEVIDSLTNRCGALEQEKHEAVAAERERCAKACKDVRLNEISAPADWHNDACECCIRAIREGEQS